MSNNSNQSYGDSVRISDIISQLWTKKILFIIIIIAFTAVSYLYARFFTSPKYVSTAKIVVLQASSDTGKISSSDVAVSTYLVNDYIELIVDRTVLEEVSRELKLNTSYESLRRRVSVRNPENSRILEVSVVTSDPQSSRLIADKICVVAKDKITNLLSVDKVNIFSNANLPTHDSSTPLSTMLLVGAMIGVIFVIALAVLLSIFDDKIKTPEDVEKYTGLPTLASIPYNDAKAGKRKRYKKEKAGAK